MFFRHPAVRISICVLFALSVFLFVLPLQLLATILSDPLGILLLLTTTLVTYILIKKRPRAPIPTRDSRAEAILAWEIRNLCGQQCLAIWINGTLLPETEWPPFIGEATLCDIVTRKTHFTVRMHCYHHGRLVEVRTLKFDRALINSVEPEK